METVCIFYALLDAPYSWFKTTFEIKKPFWLSPPVKRNNAWSVFLITSQTPISRRQTYGARLTYAVPEAASPAAVLPSTGAIRATSAGHDPISALSASPRIRSVIRLSNLATHTLFLHLIDLTKARRTRRWRYGGRSGRFPTAFSKEICVMCGEKGKFRKDSVELLTRMTAKKCSEFNRFRFVWGISIGMKFVVLTVLESGKRKKKDMKKLQNVVE